MDSNADMNISLESCKQSRCRGLASSSFYRTVYSEIEEVGWEHLVRLSEDLTILSFRVIDTNGRVHIMEIILEKTYPNCLPSVSADVPFIFNLKWSKKSRLKDVVHQFQEHLGKLQEFWSTLDDIDQSLLVVDPKQPNRTISYRQIDIGSDCFITLFINANDPFSLPECHFMGPDPRINVLRKTWRRNCKKWMKNKSIGENVSIILETKLPQPPNVIKNDEQVECGICYAQFLPTMNLEPRVGVVPTTYVIVTTAVDLFIVFVYWIGCGPSRLQGSHLMFCLEIVHIVQSQLLSNSMPGSKFSELISVFSGFFLKMLQLQLLECPLQ